MKSVLFGHGSERLTTRECLGIVLICSGAAALLIGFFPALYWICKATGRL